MTALAGLLEQPSLAPVGDAVEDTALDTALASFALRLAALEGQLARTAMTQRRLSAAQIEQRRAAGQRSARFRPRDHGRFI
jgi:hypothetical protein